MQNPVATNWLLTRRHWGAMLAALPLAAQVASSPQPVPPVAAPSGGDDVRRISERLRQIDVPMSLEPAFTFHA